MTTSASGTFEVKITPQAPDENAGEAIGRMILDKQFHGDLEAASKGQMLAAGTEVRVPQSPATLPRKGQRQG